MKHLKELKINEDFFDKYEDTEIDGFKMEIAIDELIENTKDAINKTLPSEDRHMARIEIKKIWIEKIKRWQD